MRVIAAFLMTATVLLSLPRIAEAQAGSDSSEITGVVELFTSQGCSSCPPAEAVLTELARQPNLVTLAYHVDYWDYIGWRDTFGSPQATERQRDYAKAFGGGTVYTPQAVVNGRRQVVGSRRHQIDAALAATGLQSDAIDAQIRLQRIDGHLHIRADADPSLRGQTTVLILATYDEQKQIAVRHGENAGRTLINTHPVRDWQVVGMWAGKPLEVDIPIASLTDEPEGRTGCAALLQVVTDKGAPGAILAAATLTLE
ncbi:DUF1223 domain-containing protein [Consotaella aegiceratis]|uniref:DUF1223 domain-containing protein n=1 Tax=Consotaella aegiceratis TaxID=3097961 RepID=UPI002F41723E